MFLVEYNLHIFIKRMNCKCIYHNYTLRIILLKEYIHFTIRMHCKIFYKWFYYKNDLTIWMHCKRFYKNVLEMIFITRLYFPWNATWGCRMKYFTLLIYHYPTKWPGNIFLTSFLVGQRFSAPLLNVK